LNNYIYYLSCNLFVFLHIIADKEEALKIHSLSKSKQTYCRHCEVAFVNAGIRKKKSEIPLLTKEELVCPS
jgi:hypothetical protein